MIQSSGAISPLAPQGADTVPRYQENAFPWRFLGRGRKQETPAPQLDGAVPGYTVTSEEAHPDPVWDALVEATPGGDLTQTTLWAATRQRSGARVCHLRLTAPDGRLVGGCLIQLKRVLPGIWAGAVPRGPVMFTDEPDAARRLVQEMIAAARRRSVRLLVVQPPEGSPTLVEAMQAAGFRTGAPSIAPEATLRIDLRRSEEEIFRGMNSNRRRRVREIMRGELEAGNSDDVEAFHRLHMVTARHQGFAPISLESLKAQWDILAPLGRCRIFLARHRGVPIAGEWLTSFAGVLTCKLTGYDYATQTNPAAKSAPTAVVWKVLMWARQEGLRHFDFGGFHRKSAEDFAAGQPPAPEFMTSPSYFKRSFGGEIVLLPRSEFIFTGRLARFALTGIAQRLLTSPQARRLAQRMRSDMRADNSAHAATNLHAS